MPLVYRFRLYPRSSLGRHNLFTPSVVHWVHTFYLYRRSTWGSDYYGCCWSTMDWHTSYPYHWSALGLCASNDGTFFIVIPWMTGLAYSDLSQEYILIGKLSSAWTMLPGSLH